MSNYTKATNFTAKDSLTSGNPAKVVKGSEIDTEFTAIQTAVNSKADLISATLVTPNLGTPSAGVLTNATGLPISTGVSGLATGVAALLGTPSSANLAAAITDETGSGALVFATSPTLVTPALGTPSALVGTNITGTASGLTAGNVTTNANLTGHITSVGNAAVLGSFTSAQLATALTDETGSGAAVFATSPTLVTPALGTPSSATLTNATGLPVATGISGLGTGIATALAVNTGSAGAPVLFNGALGTPSSGTVTNLTGTASININGTVGGTTPAAGAFTTLSASGAVTLSAGTANGVTYLNGSKVLTSGNELVFNATYLRLGSGTGGIQFNGDTAAANALDDYEEGSWTPAVRGDGTAGTYETTNAYGFYTKIGNAVTVSFDLLLAGAVTGGGTGDATIINLPFTSSATTGMTARAAVGVYTVDFSAGYTYITAGLSGLSSTTIYMLQSGDNQGLLFLPISAIVAGSRLICTMTYFV